MAFMSRNGGVYYFHNLKFDGNYVLSYLLTHGWAWVEGRPSNEREFSTLIADDGAWYTVHLRFAEHIVELRDSLKKIPLPLSAIPTAFGLNDICKGTIDYVSVRPDGYVPTAEEWEYVFDDVRIVSKAMDILDGQGLKSLTQSSDAFNEFKSGVEYRGIFPILSDDIDEFIRLSYRGGFTYADPRFSGEVHNVRGIVVDANSMYPSVMYNKPLPYGKPEWSDDLPEEGLWVGKFILSMRVKPNHIPCISATRHVKFGTADYTPEFEGELTITSVDWQLIQSQYDIEWFDFEGGYTFKSANDIFHSYIDHWYSVKKHATGGKRWIAKGQLNKLYGKFGMRTTLASKRPELGDDGVVKYTRLPEETRDPEYTPLATFVTAWARYVMVSAAQANYDTFAYCDTDSMHLLGETVRGVKVDDSELGAWKVEGHFTRAVYRRAKCYAEDIDGDMCVHIAGLPAKLAPQVTYDDMLHGAEIGGKLVPKHVPGGVRLVETTFTIK